jgi:hypothetical protein
MLGRKDLYDTQLVAHFTNAKGDWLPMDIGIPFIAWEDGRDEGVALTGRTCARQLPDKLESRRIPLADCRYRQSV